MKTPRPIGVIRPLEPILGRARRRWRGGPLVPMIWRRRLRAHAAPLRKAVQTAPAAPTHVFNLTLVWPAGIAARAEPIRGFETRLREVFRAGRGGGERETSRLATLVERLWLRSGNAGAPGTAIPPAPEPTSRRLAQGPKRDESEASPRRGTEPAPVKSRGVPRLWPRAGMAAARAAIPPPPGGAALPSTGAGIAWPGTPRRGGTAMANAGAGIAWPGTPRRGGAAMANAGAGIAWPGTPRGSGAAMANAGAGIAWPGTPRGGGAAMANAGTGIAGAGGPRAGGLQVRTGAMRHWRDSQPARPVVGEPTGGESADAFSMQAPGAPVRRGFAARPESPTAGRRRPSRPRTNLVWRKDESGDAPTTPSHPHLRRTSAPELVWRRPAPAPARGEAEASRQLSPDGRGRGDVHVHVDRPAATPAPAPAAPAPAAIQPAEMSRLVDEVVRRLDRIGRDERLRRGI